MGSIHYVRKMRDSQAVCGMSHPKMEKTTIHAAVTCPQCRGLMWHREKKRK